jgi:hypothetical protein
MVVIRLHRLDGPDRSHNPTAPAGKEDPSPQRLAISSVDRFSGRINRM